MAKVPKTIKPYGNYSCPVPSWEERDEGRTLMDLQSFISLRKKKSTSSFSNNNI
jgi:hypothetical protein